MALALKKNPIFLLLMLAVGCGVFAFYEVKGENRVCRLRVVSYNVGTLNGEKPCFEGLVRAIEKEGRPDVVLLQELPDKAYLLRIGKALGLGYHAFGLDSAGGSKRGLGILSSRLLVKAEVHLLKPHGHAVLTAEMGLGGKTLVVSSVHLARVRGLKQGKEGFEVSWGRFFTLLKAEFLDETPRSMAVTEMLKLPGLMGSETVIIGGDFNTVPFSTAIRAMYPRYEDALWPSMDYFIGTYRMVNFPVKPRIDYIFYSEGIIVEAAGVIRDGSGDHWPVWAVIDKKV